MTVWVWVWRMTEREWVARCSFPSPTGAWPPPTGAAACSGRGVTTETEMNVLRPVFTKLVQPCDDASDSVLIENNGVAPKWGYNPFSSNFRY